MIELIAFGATVGVLALIGASKKHSKKTAPPKKQTISQQEADELITVVLPTINNDK